MKNAIMITLSMLMICNNTHSNIIDSISFEEENFSRYNLFLKKEIELFKVINSKEMTPEEADAYAVDFCTIHALSALWVIHNKIKPTKDELRAFDEEMNKLAKKLRSNNYYNSLFMIYLFGDFKQRLEIKKYASKEKKEKYLNEAKLQLNRLPHILASIRDRKSADIGAVEFLRITYYSMLLKATVEIPHNEGTLLDGKRNEKIIQALDRLKKCDYYDSYYLKKVTL